MTKENFKSILKKYLEISEYITDLYHIGFDISDNPKFPIQNLVYDMFVEILQSTYNEEGVEWISFYIFEYSSYDRLNPEEWMYPKKEPSAWDADNNPICYNIDSLYDYVTEYCKKEN